MYKKIYFANPNSDFNSYILKKDETLQEKTLDSLNKINLFVGPNNSGKSRFIRQLAAQNFYLFQDDETSVESYNSILDSFKSEFSSIFAGSSITKVQDVSTELPPLPPISRFDSKNNYLKNLEDILDSIQKIPTTPRVSSHGGKMGNFETTSGVEKLKNLVKTYREKIKPFQQRQHPHKIYIPILRGLRSVSSTENDEYKTKTKLDYFQSTSDDGFEIFTGLDLYERNRKMSHGTYEERNNRDSFIKFLSQEFFESETVELISRDDKTLWIRIGNEPEQPIHHLGDGIQSIIILTFPLFVNKDKRLMVFIEEPEMLIHPGLQRVLLKCFNRADFTNFQFFLTTHSNHFLDLTLDDGNTSIYTVKKKLNEEQLKNPTHSNSTIENISTGDNNILGLLGVRNSSVMLSNCTIWVEGITDRLYIRHYLNLYQKNLKKGQIYKEDVHFSFVEYGGNNITHWSFLDNKPEPAINVEKLCGKLMLITDKDGSTKISRQAQLKKKLGSRYFCLDSREIENIISKKVLVDVVKGYENISCLPNENFTETDYSDVPLGSYIEKNILKNSKLRKGTYKGDSGTVANKLDFCRKVIKCTIDYQDMSNEAKKISTKIYNFIKLNNE